MRVGTERGRDERRVDGDAGAAHGAHPRGERVLGGALEPVAVAVRPFGDGHPGARAGVGQVAEGPAQEVDRVRTPRADPAAATRRVEQPPVPAQRDARAGRERAPLHVLDRSHHTLLHELAEPSASRVVTELEVQQRDHARVACSRFHRERIVLVAPERLVAQHGLARLDRGDDELAVAERRRVHRDHIDVVTRRSARQASSSRGDTTSTTSHPSVAAKTGATTRRPKPRPITPTPTVAVVPIRPLLARPPLLRGEGTPERPLSGAVTGRPAGASTLPPGACSPGRWSADRVRMGCPQWARGSPIGRRVGCSCPRAAPTTTRTPPDRPVSPCSSPWRVGASRICSSRPSSPRSSSSSW